MGPVCPCERAINELQTCCSDTGLHHAGPKASERERRLRSRPLSRAELRALRARERKTFCKVRRTKTRSGELMISRAERVHTKEALHDFPSCPRAACALANNWRELYALQRAHKFSKIVSSSRKEISLSLANFSPLALISVRMQKQKFRPFSALRKSRRQKKTIELCSKRANSDEWRRRRRRRLR